MKSETEVVRDLLEGLVAQKQFIEVDGARAGSMLSIEIRVHADDTARVVGQGGRNVGALWTIIRAMARRRNERIIPALLEPQVGKASGNRGFTHDPDWTPEFTRKLLVQTVNEVLEHPWKLKETHRESATIFQVTPDNRELATYEGELSDAFAMIFEAIGKRLGRHVLIAGPDNPMRNST